MGSCSCVLLRRRGFRAAAVERLLEVAQLEEVLDAGQQLDLIDGLGEEVVAAAFAGALHVAELVQGGDHDDGDVAITRIVLEEAADLKAAAFGHHDVEQDEVGDLTLDCEERGFAIARQPNLYSQRFKVGLEQFEDLGVIVDDQDLGWGVAAWIAAHSSWRSGFLRSLTQTGAVCNRQTGVRSGSVAWLVGNPVDVYIALA